MKLIKYPNPILNQKSEICKEEDLPQILQSYPEMCRIMKEHNGVGLAAIQVGIPKTFCIIVSKSTDLGGPHWSTPPSLVINPEVIEISKEIKKEHEGCLSLPMFWEKVERPLEVLVQYRDEQWQLRTAVFYDILARCVLHELDHMLGEPIHNKVSPMVKHMWEKKLQKKGMI